MSDTRCQLMAAVPHGLHMAVHVGHNVGLVTLTLYTNVGNVADVRARVVSTHLTAALLRPSMVGGVLCGLSAARSAILSQARDVMKTRSLATEIIFNLAPHTKISPALQQFGIRDTDTDILAITVDIVPKEKFKEINFESGFEVDENLTPNAAILKSVLQGDVVDIELLEGLKDRESITKLYKLTAEELSLDDIERCCISRMACKGFL
ncbi:EKC/KEOPS complex subunit TPRKB [Hyalella azteca]|uniref:EKC/KEOPS complex subunit TPRKB n=1 Tax=Hyalella azteca TaxID=294128 RepID=A0A8B7NWM5_HYAAZ|nr:EKC/KEOPS complex subunit TPRKB [Hyalella azteca]